MKKNYVSLTLFFCVACLSNQLMATDYYLKSSGLLTTLSSWGTNTDGSGTAPSNFNTGSNVYHIVNRTSFSHTNNFNLNTAQSVIIGDGVTGINMTISGSGIISNAPVSIASSATLTVSKVSSYVTTFASLDIASTVIFNAATASILPANYGNLTINQNAILSSQIYVYGNLGISSGQTLNLNGFILNIDATVTGAGEIISSNTSGIYFTGGQTGNIGTLNFNGASPQINFLDFTFGNTTSYASLGTDLTISGGYLAFHSGGLDINGHVLTIDATSDVQFPMAETDGFIRGSSNSSLIILGTIANGGGDVSLYMDQMSSSTRSLKVLCLNSSGAFMTIGNDLEITDSLSVLDGNLDLNDFLTLKSTDALKGRLSRIGSGGAVNGNLKAESFAKAGSTGWTVLAPQGVSGLSVASWDAAGIPMSCVGCTYDPSTVDGFVSIQGYDEAGSGGAEYIELTSASPLTEGKGYWVYLGDGATSTNDITWLNYGGVVTGNVSVSVTKTTGSTTPGSNLVSNPYASPISWASVLAASSNLNNAIYVYNPDLEATTQYVGGVASPGGTSGITNTIPAGQGFYIDATSNTTVNFTENCKINANTSANPLLKTASDIGTVFRLKVSGAANGSDETAIRFHSSATTNFDGALDAHKIFGTPGYQGWPGTYSDYTTISTRMTNEDYSINSLPPIQAPTVIPVLVKVKATAQYTISPLEIENLPSNACVTLTDKLLNITHDLRSGAYVCTIPDTTTAPRFELTICANGIAASVTSLNNTNNSVIISQNDDGAFVKTSFETNTHAVISAYNMMGQQIMENKEIEGTNNLVFLEFKDVHHQIVIIKVATEKGQTTKKVFVN